jgi:hypothetical protein
MKIMEEAGFPPVVVARAMIGGHYGVLRFIENFDKSDKDEVEGVKRLNLTLLEMALDIGFVPYKAPVWAVKKLVERSDRGFLELISKVRRMLDPNGIMNPRRW